jgi:hypothetical protein
MEQIQYRVISAINTSRKAIQLQAWIGSAGSRRLRLPDFKTIGTWRWSALSTGRLYPPRSIPQWAPRSEWGRKDYVNENFQKDNRVSNTRPSGLYGSVSSTNWGNAQLVLKNHLEHFEQFSRMILNISPDNLKLLSNKHVKYVLACSLNTFNPQVITNPEPLPIGLFIWHFSSGMTSEIES